jgi:hypothetical protein
MAESYFSRRARFWGDHGNARKLDLKVTKCLLSLRFMLATSLFHPPHNLALS